MARQPGCTLQLLKTGLVGAGVIPAKVIGRQIGSIYSGGVTMSEQVYDFGFGVDANYVKYAGVLMTNLVLQHPGRQLHFHLACDGINEEDRQRLDTFIKLYRNVELYIYDLKKVLDQLNPVCKDTPKRLNRSVLLKILLPAYVPQEIERLVYMDVDVICCRRLDELFSMDLQGKVIAAVLDTNSRKNAAALGLKHSRYYFSGMMVFDLPAWNGRQTTGRITDYYQQHSERLIFLEQDALNAVVNGAFADLDKRYNFLIEVNNPLMIKYPENVAVLHCVNEAKAWTKGCLPEIRELYWRMYGSRCGTICSLLNRLQSKRHF